MAGCVYKMRGKGPGKPHRHVKDDATSWGATWVWEVNGEADKAWLYSGKNFMQVDEWMTSIIKCKAVLVGGNSNEVGTCVRRVDVYRDAALHPDQESDFPAEYVFFGLQKLIAYDDTARSFSYAAVGGNLPGFDVDGLIEYKSHFQVLKHPTSSDKALIQWGYSSKPSPYITQEQGDTLCHGLYQQAVEDLNTRLASAAAASN
eukprot:c17587_g1_i1 orf=50-658(-)